MLKKALIVSLMSDFTIEEERTVSREQITRFENRESRVGKRSDVRIWCVKAFTMAGEPIKYISVIRG